VVSANKEVMAVFKNSKQEDSFGGCHHLPSLQGVATHSYYNMSHMLQHTPQEKFFLLCKLVNRLWHIDISLQIQYQKKNHYLTKIF